MLRNDSQYCVFQLLFVWSLKAVDLADNLRKGISTPLCSHPVDNFVDCYVLERVNEVLVGNSEDASVEHRGGDSLARGAVTIVVQVIEVVDHSRNSFFIIIFAQCDCVVFRFLYGPHFSTRS